MIDPRDPNYTNTPVSEKRPKFEYEPEDRCAKPYVTVITPFFNTDEVFHETAASVFRQSFQQWEWLIVNDGSTEPSALAVLAEYRGRDPRIRVIDHAENLGLGAARNTGFGAARTEYVVQLDSDDLLEPTAIEKWLWFLQSHPEYAFVKGYSVGFGAQEYLWQKGFHHDFLTENQVDATSMICRTVHEAVGGYDVTMRGGFEDWDFWLRCAASGYWGKTIPEYLDWYRRRPTHADRWDDWGADNQNHFLRKAKKKYPTLWDGGFPKIEPRFHMPYESIPIDLPCGNRLAKKRPRLLFIVPWLTWGGADKFNLDLVKLLVTQYGYEVTVATTLEGDHSWMPLFGDSTPDIFPLHHFLRLPDYPHFLHYLIRSRQVDTVIISNSQLGYLLLPYLRSRCPEVAFMDYLHMEEEHWRNGGHPRASLNQAGQLDLTVVSSAHLKNWMVKRGGEAERIEICTINIDSNDWEPAKHDRASLRAELGIEAEVPVILYAGRLCPQKQPLVFGETIRRLRQRQQKFICLVAGDGEERKPLEGLLRKHKLDCVRLLGSVSPQRMQELLALSDIFFLPSQMEGISLAIYEAMAMEVVPVGADVGGQRELVTPECGVLAQRGPDEAAAYVEVLSDLLADGDRRQMMGRAARRRVCEQFRLEQMGARMATLIHRAGEMRHISPRPAVSVGYALSTAAHMIELTRLENLAEQLWAERYRNGAQENILLNNTLIALRRRLYPAYRWAVNHGLWWLIPLNRRLNLLLGGRLIR